MDVYKQYSIVEIFSVKKRIKAKFNKIFLYRLEFKK